MAIFEKICWFLSIWTTAEGSLVVLWPKGMVQLTRFLFPTWGELASTFERRDLRRIALIELAFGLLLGGYLLWAP
jgi:hypothetical protein